MDMALPEFIKKSIETKLTKYCDDMAPENIRDIVRLKFNITKNTIILYQERPSLTVPSRCTKLYVAQFRYDTKTQKWTLYWADRNSVWHIYTECNSKKKFDDLLKEVDKDPTEIFWE